MGPCLSSSAQYDENTSPKRQHRARMYVDNYDHDVHCNESANGRNIRQRETKPSKNLEFYQNKIRSDYSWGYKLEEMLQWKGDYVLLERHHGYIQWLFPIPEGSGVNPYAQSLQEHEAKAIRSDEFLQLCVLEAYKMMLDFYGMELVSSKTGKIRRTENWRQRFHHLNNSTHNFRRITRIVKSLGELGYPHFQVPWLAFILKEAIVKKTLPRLQGSVVHWIDAITRDEDRAKLIEIYERFRNPVKAAGKDEYELSEKNDDDRNSSGDINNKHRQEMSKVSPKLNINYQNKGSDDFASSARDGRSIHLENDVDMSHQYARSNLDRRK